MPHVRLVLAVLLVVAGISGTVFWLGQDVERTPVPDPPTVKLFAGEREVHGVLGSHCWQRRGERVCVERFDGKGRAVRGYLRDEAVTPLTDLRFQVGTSDEPVNLSYRVVDDEGRVVASGDGSDSFRLDLREDNYLVVVSSAWRTGNATHMYELEFVQPGEEGWNLSAYLPGVIPTVRDEMSAFVDEVEDAADG
jgi:hypothetical protein